MTDTTDPGDQLEPADEAPPALTIIDAIAQVQAILDQLQTAAVNPATVNPDGTPGAVAPGELIEAAWGNAVVDTLGRIAKRFTANGVAVNVTDTNLYTIATLAIPAQTRAGVLFIFGNHFVNGPATAIDISGRLDYATTVATTRIHGATSAVVTGSVPVAAGAHTVEILLRIVTGTGAGTFADPTSNRLDVLWIGV